MPRSQVISPEAAEGVRAIQQQPVRPTVFIGLGGTGAEVLLRLRRKFFENSLDPTHPSVRFVYVDCDLDGEDNALGDPRAIPVRSKIRFEPNEKVQATVPADFVSQLLVSQGLYSHILEWLPAARPASIEQGAHGVRPLGRLAFFCNFEKITRAIGNAYEELETARPPGAQVQADGRPRFVVVASVAGGTGSGMFLDLGFWLKQKYGDQATIQGLFVLPDAFRHVQQYENKAANGYAALKELEFFHEPKDHGFDPRRTGPRGGSKHDFRVRWQTRSAQPQDLQPIPTPAYKVVHFVSGRNERDVVIGGSEENMRAVFEMLAEYLYWDLDRSHFGAAVRGARDNVFGIAQESIFRADYDVPGVDGGTTITEYFSERYMTCGLAKICFPIPRIRFLCAYRLAEDILRSWLRPGTPIDDLKGHAKALAETPPSQMTLGLGWTSARLVQRVSTKEERSLRAEILRIGADCLKKITPQSTRADVQKQCDEVLKESIRTEGSGQNWGKWPLDIRGKGERMATEEAANFDKRVGELLAHADYGPVLTTNIVEHLRQYALTLAEKEKSAAAGSMRSSEAEEGNLRQTLDFYEDVHSHWSKAHPLRARTLPRLARRALRQAGTVASLKIDRYSHEAVAKLLGQLAQKIEAILSDLRRFQGKLEGERVRLEEARKALDAMQSDHFFEVDLYQTGDYKEFYKLGDETPVSIGDKFLAERRWSMHTVMTELCSEQLKDLGQQLFLFGVDGKFRELPGGKDCVAALLSRHPGQGWKDRLQNLIKSGRPWIKEGRLAYGSGAGIVLQTVVGLSITTVGPDHEFRTYLDSQLDATERPAVGEIGEPGSVVILVEKSRFPLTYISGIDDLRAEYVNRRAVGEGLAAMHLHPSFGDLPDIVVKADDDVKQEVECRRLLLQGIIFGIIERKIVQDANVGERILLTYHSEVDGLPRTVEHWGEGTFVQSLAKNTQLTAHLKASLAAVARNLDEDRRRKLLKILYRYLTKTFPGQQIVNPNSTSTECFAVNHAALQPWWMTLHQALDGPGLKEYLEPDSPPALTTFARDTGGGYWTFLPSELNASS